jgi:hypothetical protein
MFGAPIPITVGEVLARDGSVFADVKADHRAGAAAPLR